MLRQEINLYRPLAAPPAPKSFLSWKLFLFCNITFVAMFTLIYLFTLWDLHHLRSKKSTLLTQADQLQKKFFDIKKSYPSIFFSENVTESIHELKQKLESRAKILETLSKHMPLSQILLALPKVITPNVWLTDISVDNGGDNVTLKGNSLRMDNLQIFLGNVLREKLFSTYTMNVKNIENTGKDTVNGALNFEINLAKKTS